MNLRAVLLLALLSGCTTTNYAPPPVSGSPSTTAVFIRERAEPLAWNVSVYIDDRKMASIANRSSATFAVPPGKHSFKLDWPALAGQLDLSGDLELLPNETAYFLVAGDFEFTGMTYKAIKYNQSVGLIPLTRAEADRILGELATK
jgi:hypothetical protein